MTFNSKIVISIIGLGILLSSGLYSYKQFSAGSDHVQPISSYPSITSTTSIASCMTGACTTTPVKATHPVSHAPTTSTSTIQATPNPVKQTPRESSAGLKYVMTTLFWVGEPADADNDFIRNDESAWQSNWQEDYGGIDSADCRKGYLPCAFTPKQNPFYFALPYNDLNAQGLPKASQKLVPWYTEALAASNISVLKNRWIKVKSGSKTCYAQWEDVGPNEEDDFSYVFGDSLPKNTFGEKAGLDLSPAMFDCLGLKDNAKTYWDFVGENDVPPGPWRDIVTVSGVAW